LRIAAFDASIGRRATFGPTAETGRIAGVQGHQGKLGLAVAVETETPPAVVRLANRSIERSALEFLRPVEIVGQHRHMPNLHKQTPFSLAAL
jgi:hypothetical protein